MRKLTIMVAAGLAAVGIMAAQASACNGSWSRTPINCSAYVAGAEDNNTPHTNTNGANANIYINDPSVPAATGCGQGNGNDFAVSSGWVGVSGFDANTGFIILIQDGYLKQRGNNNGNPCTVYEIPGTSFNVSCGQSVTVGSTYNFNVYDSGTAAVFDFAGVQKYSESWSSLGLHPSEIAGAWVPQVSGEILSYNIQMPGTSSNPELFTNMQERYGSGNWDSSSDQNWSTSNPHFPAWNGVGPNNVNQTHINNSFSNTYNSQFQQVQVQDACTSS
jgi:hypothetical protein